MPYRDELEALRARVEALEAERDGLAEALERSRAGLASAVAWMAGLPHEASIPWRSLHGGEPIAVTFVNEQKIKLTLASVGYDGRERDEVTIIAGGEHRVETHTGHLWRLRDEGRIVWQDYVRAGQTRLSA